MKDLGAISLPLSLPLECNLQVNEGGEGEEEGTCITKENRNQSIGD